MNAEARTSIDTLLTTLKEKLAAPGMSLLPLLTTMSRFTRYSLANQMLIFAQRPTATHVLGYRSWLKAGYQVRKGERGIAIYAPVRIAPQGAAETSVGASPQAVSRQGKPRASSHGSAPGVPADGALTEVPAPRLGYRVAYVFDISQVDALPDTDATALLTELTGTPDAHRATEQLKAFLFGHNIELEYKVLAPGLMGYTDGRRITCGIGQPSHVEFATLAHETTHVLLHFDRETGNRPDLTTRETEAEAVTFLLCSQLGIAGTDASVEYIQSYRGTPDTLDASLERIRVTAQRLSTELDAIRFDAEHEPGPA